MACGSPHWLASHCERLWAKREQQIRSVVDSTAGMYGDLQGIAGRALGEIEGLDFQLLEGPVSDEDGED